MTGYGKDLIEAEIKAFVDEYVDSFISWDIILFYYHNPDALEKASSLAGRLGRVDKDIKGGLVHLVDKKVLTVTDGDTYSFTPDPRLAEQIKNFNDALAVASLRLAILSQVLSKGKARPWK